MVRPVCSWLFSRNVEDARDLVGGFCAGGNEVMDIFEFNDLFYEIVSLYFLNLIIILRLFYTKNFLVILVWPIGIYSIGPYISYAYLYAPWLSNYIFPENFLEETELFTVFLILIVILDKFFHLGNVLRRYVLGRHIVSVGSSKLMRVCFYISGLAAAFFQIALMTQRGSILTGNYVQSAIPSAGGDDQPIAWGVLGGLYEVFFACTVVLFIARRERSPFSKDAAFYSLVLLLRLLGGTRLILVKELSVLLFIMVAQKRVRVFFVGLAAVAVVVLGSLVGSARTNGGAGEFGPLSSLVYESSFAALTLNIADNIAHDPSAYQYYRPGDVVADLVASLVPSFIRNIFVPETKDRELNMATEAGFDTASPVGAMELFSSSIYIFLNPWVAPLLYPVLLWAIIKTRYNLKIKSYLLLSIFIESLNTWRDPFEVSLKIILQSVVVYYFVGMDWRSLFGSLRRRDGPGKFHTTELSVKNPSEG